MTQRIEANNSTRVIGTVRRGEVLRWKLEKMNIEVTERLVR